MTIHPLKNQNGNIVGIWGIVRDRTEQRKAELSLRRSEEKYRNILKSIGEGYYEYDLKGNLTDFNNATMELHRRSTDELSVLNFRQYGYPEQYYKN